MGSEHKSKKRGRSSSPAKKKLKRKYRGDHPKKLRHTSSDSTSSEEDISLTSDDYPSSAEERRKEAKKKRSKKPKKKSRASSASSSRSPTPDKSKKKSKSKDDKDDSKKEKHKKDRKRSLSSKKKRRSRSDNSDSSESGGDSPVRKEKMKKKRSPSPLRVKKKKSVSPVKDVEKKKKRSVSPVRLKKKSSPSPPRKDKVNRSPSPIKKKRSKSPPKSKKKSVSPPPGKPKAKSPPRKSPPRSSRSSGSPTPKKENKGAPGSLEKSPTSNRKERESPSTSRRKRSESPPPHRRKKESDSPTPQKHNKESSSPAPRKKSKSPSPRRHKNERESPPRRKKSPSPHRPKKRSRSPPPKKSRSPPPRSSKRESESPSRTKQGESPAPDRHKKEAFRKESPSPCQSGERSPITVKKGKSPEKNVDVSTAVQHPLKCPSPTSTSRMLSAKAESEKLKKESSVPLPKVAPATLPSDNKKDRVETSLPADITKDRVETFVSADNKKDRVETAASADNKKDRIETASADNKKDRVETAASADNKKDRVETASADSKKDRVETASADNKKDRIETAAPADNKKDRIETASADNKKDRIETAAPAVNKKERVETSILPDNKKDRAETSVSTDKKKDRVDKSVKPEIKEATEEKKEEAATTEIKKDNIISVKTETPAGNIDSSLDKTVPTSDKTGVIADRTGVIADKVDLASVETGSVSGKAATNKIDSVSETSLTIPDTDTVSGKMSTAVESISDAPVVIRPNTDVPLPPGYLEKQMAETSALSTPNTTGKPTGNLPGKTISKPLGTTVKPLRQTLPLFKRSGIATALHQKKTEDNSSKKSGSPSVFRTRKKSTSPTRNRKKSRSPSPSRIRKRSRSSSPRGRRRSKSPKRERKRSRSRSPYRHRKDERAKSPVKQRRRSRTPTPPRSKKDRDRSPDKKRKNDEKRKEEEKKDRDEKDKDKLRRSDDRRSNRDDRGTKDDKERRKKEEKDPKNNKRDKSPDKKDISELEEEMRKRKERIEAWRNANRKKEETPNGEEDTDDKKASEKKWSLEDDDDEEEEQPIEIKEEEPDGKENETAPKAQEKKDVKKPVAKETGGDEEDPLDFFMKGIEVEVNKITGKPTNTTTGTKTKTITVVKTVVSKTSEQAKPEVMEQNQDALEYSSEEEGNNDIQASDFTDVTKRKKELTVADHSKIYYAQFRRNFYVEVPELARMTPDEVKLMRDGLGDIQVRGKNIPKPIKTWAQAGLSAKVMNVLRKCLYEKPTPIQAQALPIAMSGRDMIGIAKTGSGKTLAFVLPMLRHVLDQPALDEGDGPIAIIMTPTRELALQIFRESKKFCKALNLNVSCIYGGSGISEQIAELKRGTEMIVCTPGRMIDMLAANNGRVTNCRRCTYLVLDEADRMFDMGFEPQVMRILDNIRPDRQTVLFSATFPRQMEAMARKVLTKPIEVQVGGRSVVCSDVEQHAIVIEEDNKFFKILELLGVYQEKGSILLFVERQETADRLFKDLLKKGYPCLSLHGGMDQFDRDSTIADFKNGVTKLMVSTSVAARGLDVKNLILVINFDCPNHYEDYVHRVGRTGRAGNKGTAFTFVTPEQGRNAGDIIKAFELSKSEMPKDVLTLWNSFRADMEKEGKTIKMNSGFSGKGFKFNAEEDAQVNEEKKMRKFTLGLQDSDDEAEAAENAMDKIEADLEKIFSSKPKVALQPEVVEAQKVKVAEQNVDKDKLKQASTIAALINKKLSSGQVMDRNTAATAHIMQGGALESLTGVGLAKQLADKVNAKLNYKAAEVENQVDEKPTLVRYEEEIDINDFPQQARWRITSKEIIEQVRELSEAGVTVRGLYIPPNKKPTEEEKRLHLYIESLSERSIQIAKAEIKRLLKEELIKAESNTYRPAQQTGRYKVL